jgi:hypothetical protein
LVNSADLVSAHTGTPSADITQLEFFITVTDQAGTQETIESATQSLSAAEKDALFATTSSVAGLYTVRVYVIDPANSFLPIGSYVEHLNHYRYTVQHADMLMSASSWLFGRSSYSTGTTEFLIIGRDEFGNAITTTLRSVAAADITVKVCAGAASAAAETRAATCASGAAPSTVISVTQQLSGEFAVIFQIATGGPHNVQVWDPISAIGPNPTQPQPLANVAQALPVSAALSQVVAGSGPSPNGGVFSTGPSSFTIQWYTSDGAIASAGPDTFTATWSPASSITATLPSGAFYEDNYDGTYTVSFFGGVVGMVTVTLMADGAPLQVFACPNPFPSQHR